MFSTIRSPAFSEFVIILVGDTAFHLPQDDMLYETLRRMNEARPFKLVFLFEGLYRGVEEARRVLARSLELLIMKGLLDFLHSPPIIRIA